VTELDIAMIPPGTTLILGRCKRCGNWPNEPHSGHLYIGTTLGPLLAFMPGVSVGSSDDPPSNKGGQGET